jgi:iron complex outermembrane receptor protein
VFAGVRNLLDREYYEHLSYLRDPYALGVKVPEPGRTIYANAQYAF